MGAMRAFVAVALASLTIVVAGCGGASSSTGSPAAGKLGAGAAQLVPADALAYASVDTDQSSQQWQQLDALTQGLAVRAKVLQQLSAALAQYGLAYDRDVKPALGKELDIAVLKVEAGNPEAVAFTQPADEAKLRALASKFDQRSEHYTVEQVGGWSVVADSEDAFAAVRSAQSGRSLADTSGYTAAQSQGGGSTITRVYLAQGAFTTLGKNLPSAGKTAPAWAAAKVDVGSDTVRASALAAGNAVAAPYTPELLRDVPSRAALAVSFKGSAQLAQALAAAQANMLPLRQLAPLLTGEGVLYVRANGLAPEVAVELAPKDPQAALARARAVLSGAGAAGRVGPLPLTAQLSAGKLVIADSPAAVSALRGGAKLVDDAAFKDALKEAGAPKLRSALVYADVAQLAPFLQLAAQAGGGKPVDPAVTDALGHVGPLVAWATHSSTGSRFELWAKRR
jgi:Protein of unknown function (DUF3352)